MILSLIAGVVALIVVIGLLQVWKSFSEYAGHLYTMGWSSFKRDWRDWSITKRVAFIIGYTLMLVVWLLIAIFLLFCLLLIIVKIVEIFQGK